MHITSVAFAVTVDLLLIFDLQYMASRGHRVIGCAQYLLPEDRYPTDYAFSKKDKKYPDSEYCFLGLISLEDPPKHGVREAIGTLRLAGIRVMMVTGSLPIRGNLSFSPRSYLRHLYVGDHPKTAEAIARKINLMIGDTKETLSVKTGRPIEQIYDDEISAVVIHGDDIDSLEGWQWDLSRPRESPRVACYTDPDIIQSLRSKRSCLRGRHLNTSSK
jgi:sodium/potassium-transporting ATPase subunit alpha